MTRTKKVLIGVFLLLVVLGLGGYFFANHLLNSYSQHFMEVLARRSKKHGVLVTEPQFRAAQITGFSSAQWDGIYTELKFPESEAFDPDKNFDVRIGRIDGWLSGGEEVTLVASNVDIEITLPTDGDDSSEEGSTSSRERVTAKRVQCTFPLQLSDPLPGLEDAIPEIVRLMRKGTCDLPVLATGVLEFDLNDAPVQVGIQVQASDSADSEAYRLILSAPDLHAVSDQFLEPLTAAEVDLLADNPLRAAQLLRIKNDAEDSSTKAKATDDSVPQDAYRHVLWSFLLTNKYGAPFAERVTNSHEEGDTGNTPAEREMDYRNNEVGRYYSEQKVSRREILSRISSDPLVVLQAE